MKSKTLLVFLILLLSPAYAQQIELLTNPDFDNGTNNWWYMGANVTGNNGELIFEITNPGVNEWDIQLGQNGFTLKHGYKYILSWRAKRESGALNFRVQLDHDPYTYLFGEQTNEDGSWKEATIVYENNGPDIPGIGVSVQMGGNNSKATFDYISLKEESITVNDTSVINTNPGSGPVSYYGKMQAKGNRIYGSRTNAPMQVKGTSFYWSLWGGEQFWTKGAVNALVDDWKAELIRVPMAVELNDNWTPISYGYLDPIGRDRQIKLVETLVDAAIARDIYVLIDYHSHDADTHTQNAKEFFGYMANKYGKYDNVIFEIYNEPITPDWPTIKTYAEAVIDTIRYYSDNLVVVGTEGYSQRVDNASLSPINDNNVAYVFHFYANHTETEQLYVSNALNNNVALFATEWGNIYVWGDKTNRTDADAFAVSDVWHDMVDANMISSANWCVKSTNMNSTNPNEACLFNEQFGAISRTGDGWRDTTIMTPSGKYVYKWLQKQAQSVKWRETVQVPNSPILLSPVSNMIKSNINATFVWSKIRNAAKYNFQLSSNSQFSTIIQSDSTLTDTTLSAKGLFEGQKYYWRIQTMNIAGTSPWSETRNFTTIISTPSNLKVEMTAQKELKLQWSDNSANEDGYLIERKKSTNQNYSILDSVKNGTPVYYDKTIEQGQTYNYRVAAFTIYAKSDYSNEATIIVTGVKNDKLPTEFSLSQNFPNPFNPATKIKFALPQSSQTKLTIYDVLGRAVQTLINQELKAGYHEINFNANDMAGGIYFYRIKAGNFTETKKLILLK